MNATRWCLLDRVTLSAGDSMDLSTAFDLHAVSTLDLVVTVHTAATGTSPLLRVRHAMSATDADAWLDFASAVAVDLSATGATWAHADAFTGYLAWSLDGTLESSAIVSLHLIARN